MNLPSVAGRMQTTHADFQRACQIVLAQLQEDPLVDNSYVQLICEAIRCSRECCEIAGGSETAAELTRLRAENERLAAESDLLFERLDQARALLSHNLTMHLRTEDNREHLEAVAKFLEETK